MKTRTNGAPRTTARALMVALAALGFVAPAGTAQDQAPEAAPPIAPPPAQPRRRPPPPPPPPPTDTAPANPPGMPMANPPGPSTTPAPTQTTTNAPEPDRRKEPEVGPYIVRDREREYIFTVELRLNSDNPTQKDRIRDPHTGTTVEVPRVTPFEFETMGLVWPILNSTASSQLNMDAVEGVLRLDDAIVTREHRLLRGYQSGVLLGRWDVKPPQGGFAVARQVTLNLAQGVTTARTTFDEAKALQVPWPRGAWPRDAASSLQPQLYVEVGFDDKNNIRPYEDKPVADAIEQWLGAMNVSDPRRINPAALAKIIAGKVWESTQIETRVVSGIDGRSGELSTRTGEFGGILVQPPATTLQTGRGTAADAAALLAALYRKAGIPARTVIGYDTGGSRSPANIGGGRRSSGLRYWVEFALYDEAANTFNWVPVDVVRMRRASSRPPAVERPWKYFGDHDELDEVIPLAFHFHPPTDVVSYGSAGFWGWFVTPTPPSAAEQVIRFSATTAPRRGGQPAQRQR